MFDKKAQVLGDAEDNAFDRPTSVKEPERADAARPVSVDATEVLDERRRRRALPASLRAVDDEKTRLALAVEKPAFGLAQRLDSFRNDGHQLPVAMGVVDEIVVQSAR